MVPDRSWATADGKGGKPTDPPLLHAANIATLALWLSVAAASIFATYFPGRKVLLEAVAAEKQSTLEITLDGEGTMSAATPEEASAGSSAPPLRPLSFLRPLTRPPVMPTVPVSAPLPMIPTIPQVPRAARALPVEEPRRAARAEGPRGADLPAAAARFAAGVTPEAPYPPYSKRNRQEGTVVVEFAVDGGGRVTAVFVKTPCRWPLLNQTAVRTVYGWSFPPGPFMTLEVPIVFKIQ